MHVIVKELHPLIQSTLKHVKYGVTDVKVEPVETISVHAEGNKGQRGFAILVNLDTGETKSMVGSWGGSNMFTATLVDNSREVIPMPVNGVVIKGQMGYPRTFATLYVHPRMVGRFLPSGESETLTDEEQQAIYCFAAIKGGEYRRDEMRRRGVTDVTVDSLVERGYLKRNRAGATQITTKGKNARTIRN
jgi:hypothetical protein